MIHPGSLRLSSWCFGLILFLTLFSESLRSYAQINSGVVADFTMDDTVCAGEPVVFTNLSQGASTYNWAFATGSVEDVPRDESFGNVLGILKNPRYVTLVRSGDEFYSFISDAGNGRVVRNYHGTRLIDHPQTTAVIHTVDTQDGLLRGIQVRQENGNWYALVVKGSGLVRLDFGPSLSAMPVSHDLGTFTGLTRGDGMLLVKEGDDWLAFITDSVANQVVRFNFGTTLTNPAPVPTALSIAPGILSHPGQFILLKDIDTWYMIICNSGTSTLARLVFGTSLLNPAPSGQNLGNPGGLDHVAGITWIEDCNTITGFCINHVQYSNTFVRLKFPSGAGGPLAGAIAGNIGTFNEPEKISEMIRAGDTIYALVTNTFGGSLSLVYFPGKGFATPGSSILKDPPPVIYSQPGTYTVMLTVDEGLPTVQRVCREITVVPEAVTDLGADKELCEGQNLALNAGTGFSKYLWNNGSTTAQIMVNQTGTYHVQVENQYGCSDADTIRVLFTQAVHASIDTSVCYGDRYFAGQQWQTTSGTYRDTLTSVMGCDSIVTTHLTIKPVVEVSLGSDTVLCGLPFIELVPVAAPGATYHWSDGSQGNTLVITLPGVYWVTAAYDGCDGNDTVTVTGCPPDPAWITVPNAFTPDGDGVNDFFRVNAHQVTTFRLEIFDRWGALLFESRDPAQGWDGRYRGGWCEPGVYPFKITFEGQEDPGSGRTITGTLTIVR